MRYHDAMEAKRWRKIWFGMILAPLGLALTGLPESQAQYWAFNKELPPREYDPGKIWLDRFLAAQQASSPKAPASHNTPDNDLYMHEYPYRSYDPGRETRRTVSSPAGESPYGIPAAALPWNRVGFAVYDDPREIPPDSSFSSPSKYSLETTPLPLESPAGRSEAAMLIVHLPGHALFGVDERRTPLKVQTNYFQSPPLDRGKKYSYTVRAAWIEEGHWVSQTRKVAVEAGLVQAIYLRSIASSPLTADKR